MSFGDDVSLATTYVLSNSWTARRNTSHARRLSEDAIMEIYLIPSPERRYMSKADMRARVKARLKERNIGSPIIISLILQVLIGIIAKLIVDWWWKNRRLGTWP